MTSTETNKKPLSTNLGVDNFKRIATESDVFVDKSLFIKEVIDSTEMAILITYPRRWGKTLNLDMLKTFFEPESKECEERKEAEFCQYYLSPSRAYRTCVEMDTKCKEDKVAYSEYHQKSWFSKLFYNEPSLGDGSNCHYAEHTFKSKLQQRVICWW